MNVNVVYWRPRYDSQKQESCVATNETIQDVDDYSWDEAGLLLMGKKKDVIFSKESLITAEIFK